MNDEAIDHSAGRSIWTRGLFMLLFALIYHLAEIVIFFVVVFQFVHVLMAKTRSAQVLELGQGLSTYVYEILQFMTFNSEQLPFPFGRWPQGGARKS
ncbi:MAG: DUF4389 domain-containing protein [Arenicellales bacterium]|jgi:hypothetical protein